MFVRFCPNDADEESKNIRLVDTAQLSLFSTRGMQVVGCWACCLKQNCCGNDQQQRLLCCG